MINRNQTYPSKKADFLLKILHNFDRCFHILMKRSCDEDLAYRAERFIYFLSRFLTPTINNVMGNIFERIAIVLVDTGSNGIGIDENIKGLRVIYKSLRYLKRHFCLHHYLEVFAFFLDSSLNRMLPIVIGVDPNRLNFIVSLIRKLFWGFSEQQA